MEDRIREVEERSAWLEHRLSEAEEMLRTAFGRIEQLEAEVKRIAERPAAEDAEEVGWEVPPHY